MIRMVIAVFFLTVSPAFGWWGGGHDILSLAAIDALPQDVPKFFRDGGRAVAHASYDPDVAKNRGTPVVRNAERVEHYLDLELLEGRPLPMERFDYIALCHEMGLRPEKVGFLPYAVGEWTERLAVAFAEHRKWPNNAHIQNKCLVYAGYVTHYAQDLCQPLHLTAHADGRPGEDGTMQHRGIHMKVDALPETLGFSRSLLSAGIAPTSVDSLMPTIMAQFSAGFRLVDEVYALGDVLPGTDLQDSAPNEHVSAFAMERSREAVRFSASLLLTAWRKSAELDLPGWLDRSVDSK